MLIGEAGVALRAALAAAGFASLATRDRTSVYVRNHRATSSALSDARAEGRDTDLGQPDPPGGARHRSGKRLLRPEEAAQLLGVGRTKLFELLRTNDLRSVTVGGSRRIPIEDVDAFVANLRGGGPAT
jgi:excisionase family DNA binding protein